MCTMRNACSAGPNMFKYVQIKFVQVYWHKEVEKIIDTWIQNLGKDEVCLEDLVDYTLYYETHRNNLPSPIMPAMKPGRASKQEKAIHGIAEHVKLASPDCSKHITLEI